MFVTDLEVIKKHHTSKEWYQGLTVKIIRVESDQTILFQYPIK